MDAFFHTPIEITVTGSLLPETFFFKLVRYVVTTETDNSGLERAVRRFLNETEEQDIEYANAKIGFLSLLGDKKSLYTFS